MSVFVTPGKTMTMRRFGNVLLQATSRQPFADSEWDAYCAQMIQENEVGLPALGFQYSLVHGPTAKQRERIKGVKFKQFKRFALVSESALVRGTITAISWLLRAETVTRGFKPNEVRRALEWLAEAAPFDVDEALRLVGEDAVFVGNTPIIS